MNLYVRYPNQGDVFFRIAPESPGHLAGAFCACTKFDAPVLPTEKRRTLETDVYHIDPQIQPLVFLAEGVEKLHTLNFPEGPAVGYIDLSGKYYSAEDQRLKYAAQTGHETLLYQLGWVKVYENNTYSHRGFQLTEGLPNRLQQDTIDGMSLMENATSPGFVQLTPDEVAAELAGVSFSTRKPADAAYMGSAPAAP